MNSINTEITYFAENLQSFPDFLGALRKLKGLAGSFFAIITKGKEERLRRENLLRTVLEDYGGIISGICFSYANDPEDLEDLRQDILINIWKGLEAYRGDSSLATWIYRVALNTCVSTIRKRSRRISTVPLSPNDDREYESNSESMERIATLHRVIATLSPLDKAVITMWLDERKYDEIADVTGLSRNNVAVRINRIKQNLNKKINAEDL